MSVNETRMGPVGVYRACAVVIAFALCCACVLVAGVLFPRQAHAAQDTTLTVVVQHGQGSSATNIDGVKLEAYEIARIGNNGYELLPAYSSTGLNFNESMTASQTTKAASAVTSIAKKQQPAAKAVTGKDGAAAFGKLEDGIYLVMQTGATGTASQYTTLTPWLVNAPQVTEGEIIYDVVAKPKPATKKATKAKRANAASKRVTKTGDTIDWSYVLLCTCIGLAAIIGAVAAARRKRE